MNDIATRQEPKPLQLIKNGIMEMGDQITSVLPSHVSLERFSQVVCTAVANSSQLAEVASTAAGRKSIFIACIQCASDGLIPDGREAALVKFKGVAQYMPMVQGLLKRMHMSGEVKAIGCEIVYSAEVDAGRFRYWRDEDGAHIHHEPILFGDKGNPVGVYATMLTKAGGVYVAYCDRDEVMRAKAASKGANTPWNGPHVLQMWKKTALKRLPKVAPVSAEVHQIIRHDDETFYDLDQPTKPTLQARLEKRSGPPAIDMGPDSEPDPHADVVDSEVVGEAPVANDDVFENISGYSAALMDSEDKAAVDKAKADALTCSWATTDAVKAQIADFAMQRLEML